MNIPTPSRSMPISGRVHLKMSVSATTDSFATTMLPRLMRGEERCRYHLICTTHRCGLPPPHAFRDRHPLASNSTSVFCCSNCTLTASLHWSTPRNTTTLKNQSILVTHPEYKKKRSRRGRRAWHRLWPSTTPVWQGTVLMPPLHHRSELAPRRGGQRGQSSRTSLATGTGSLMEWSSTRLTVNTTCAHPMRKAVLKMDCNVCC